MRNSQGVRQGVNGYVLCNQCGEEAQEVSRETSSEYAYHVRCRPTVFGYADRHEGFVQFLQTRKGAA